jgi:hypothetical protein
MTPLAGPDFIRRHPQCAHDAFVERAVRLERAQRSGEGEAHVGDVLLAHRAGHIDADQRGRREVVSGLF